MNILVVDDEYEIRMLTTSLLLAEGWSVVTAENGQEALTKMQSQQFDIVVSDVYMPVMNGVNLHRAARSNPLHRQLPFLFVSGFDDEHTRSALVNPHLEAFIRKGRPVRVLISWIQYLTTPVEERPETPPDA